MAAGIRRLATMARVMALGANRLGAAGDQVSAVRTFLPWMSYCAAAELVLRAAGAAFPAVPIVLSSCGP